MANPRKTRGEYRPIYEALFYGKDYKRLSPEAKLTLLTLKGLCDAIGIKVWPALAEVLADLTGMPLPSVKSALDELTLHRWIEWEDGIVWIVRGLEFEPQLTPENGKHRIGVQTAISGLPTSGIVDRFRAHYCAYFNESKAIREGIEGHSIANRNQPQPTTPTPTPTTSPTTTHNQPDAHQLESACRLLAAAANKGITEYFGEQPTPLRASNARTHSAVELIISAGVDLDYAAATIFAYPYTKSHKQPPRSLGYFVQYVTDRWTADAARRDATSFAPSEKHADKKRSTEGDQLRNAAVRYAKTGDPEWQAYCDERGIDWRQAA